MNKYTDGEMVRGSVVILSVGAIAGEMHVVVSVAANFQVLLFAQGHIN